MYRLTKQDQSGIDELFRAYGDAWGRRDASACAALYAADGDAIALDGEVLSGATAIEQYYERQLSGAYAGLTLTDFEVEPARGVAENVAMQNATWQLLGFRAGGGELGPVRVRATFVMRREDGTWKYVAARFMVPFEGEP